MECRAYLFDLDPSTDPYSNSQLFCAKELLGPQQKAASTTADLANTDTNLKKRHLYWTRHPPLGMSVRVEI